MMNISLVHQVSPAISECELSFLPRTAINHTKAVRQHRAYCAMLQRLGSQVISLSHNLAYPDSAFIEDTAIVLDEIAVIANMGIASRRDEPGAIARELARYRDIVYLEKPATLEGGDVMIAGRRVLAGLSQRSNKAGIDALRAVLEPLGYQVYALHLRGCLHLKSACTALSEKTLLVNPEWLFPEELSAFNLLTVDPAEPWAANIIVMNHAVCIHAGFVKTAAMLQGSGFAVATTDISEFQKAEGGLSCLSLRFVV